MILDDAKDRLSSGKGSIRCGEVISILGGLGFTVKQRRKSRHYTYNHEALDDFVGSNFACPHRAGDPVNKNYITNILRVLRNYKTQLSAYLGETNGRG